MWWAGGGGSGNAAPNFRYMALSKSSDEREGTDRAMPLPNLGTRRSLNQIMIGWGWWIIPLPNLEPARSSPNAILMLHTQAALRRHVTIFLNFLNNEFSNFLVIYVDRINKDMLSWLQFSHLVIIKKYIYFCGSVRWRHATLTLSDTNCKTCCTQKFRETKNISIKRKKCFNIIDIQVLVCMHIQNLDKCSIHMKRAQ